MQNISDDEIKLFILQKSVDQYRKAVTNSNTINDKCAREIDIAEALSEITGESGMSLAHIANIWINSLAPQGRPKKGPLCRCSCTSLNTNAHKNHVRAFIDPSNRAASAWKRIAELKKQIGHEKEMEADFGILYSKMQMQKDFGQWIREKDTIQHIAVLFIDIDDFKQLNTKYTETAVDETIFPAFQELLKALTKDIGRAYRDHGEEFVIILPNYNQNEAMEFAEKLRRAIESKEFNIDANVQNITISIGVALWPYHGSKFMEILFAANLAENRAKKKGRNRVILAEKTSLD
ncbi:GGDEF domain-containing protein [candidate division WOR-3 bacterium]|nr:GGDEF domain-containing protein [candidate division WOR-3 bacterium]